jgi:anti-sigma regulatory factor (Ser/Thr protein kinase)
MTGPVELHIPADPQMSRVARLAASGLASLAGFDVDVIEDIKIAVSEVLLALIEHGANDTIILRCSIDEDSFTVRASTVIAAFDLDHPDLVLCRTVLAGVSEAHGVDVSDGMALIWATLRAPVG